MRLSINSPIASLVTELPEHQILSIIRTALNYVGKVPEMPEIPVLPPLPLGGKFPEKKEDAPSPVAKPEFKGFLYIKCEECGKFKGFMPKSPISEYRCDCGHTTPLKDMRVLKAECKCGQKFKYLTNAKDNVISMDCFNCGSPIDLEYHDKKQEYVTIE